MNMNNFILREQFRVLQPVGFSPQGETFGVMQNPVQHGCRQDGIAHHLSPVSDLLVRCKDDRVRLVGITDEGEEPIRLFPGDWGVPNLINDDQLRFAEILQAKPGRTLDLCRIEYLYEVAHAFKTDGVACLDRLHPKPNGEHSFPQTRRTGEDQIAESIQPVQFLQLTDLGHCDPAFKLTWVEFLQAFHIRREVGGRKIPFSPPFISTLHLGFQE